MPRHRISPFWISFAALTCHSHAFLFSIGCRRARLARGCVSRGARIVPRVLLHFFEFFSGYTENPPSLLGCMHAGRHVTQRHHERQAWKEAYTPACDPVQTVTLHERRAKCVLCIDPESTHEDGSERHHVLSVSLISWERRCLLLLLSLQRRRLLRLGTYFQPEQRNHWNSIAHDTLSVSMQRRLTTRTRTVFGPRIFAGFACIGLSLSDIISRGYVPLLRAPLYIERKCFLTLIFSE